MIPILNASQMKTCDSQTITNHHIPACVLIERAALACVNEITNRYSTDNTVSILCGPGNNGGDGVAIGRLLHIAGFDVKLLVLGNPEKYSSDLIAEINIAKSYNTYFANSLDELSDSDIIIDAIFGIGLSRPVTGEFEEAIEFINKAEAFTLSVDIPSGYSADTGVVLGYGVKADLTVTFGFIKTGLLLSDCRLNTGELVKSDVGIYLSDDVIMDTHLVEDSDLSAVPPRPINANKGTCGKVLVIAGSSNIYGACYLSAKAALTTGSGLVKIYTHPNNIASIQQNLPEAMYIPADELAQTDLLNAVNWADAVILGPGLSTNRRAQELVSFTIKNATCPILIDADGLNFLADNLSLLDEAKSNIVITPHLKEMSRLCGCSVSDINSDMLSIATEFASTHNCTVVLKNFTTVIASPTGTRYICNSGNEALATAGSGDVLSGIIGSLLGQGLSPDQSAYIGAFIHGKAGSEASKTTGIKGLLASDIIGHIN